MNKRIVLCLDGTWNTPAQELEREDGSRVYRPTNVLKVARAVKPRADDGVAQVVYYDTGIGAMAQYPGFTNGALRWFDSKLGGAWGAGFEGNVDEAYRFLAQNHEDGDEVYLFGYSRGAAQAQALCKFIDWMGGLPQKNDIYYLPRFYLKYLETRGDAAEFPRLKKQIETTGSNQQPLNPFRQLRITYLGLWDTVMALGSRSGANSATSSKDKRFLIGATLPKCVERARHAVAVDERRKDFRAEIWQDGNGQADMKQAWFPGGHGNVGGGRNSDGLANGALRWMLESVGALEVDENYLKFFRPWHNDVLANRRSLMYRIRDPRSLFNDEKASRPIVGYPATANFEIPKATFDRLNSSEGKVEVGENKVKKESYQPANLLAFLAQHPEHDHQLETVAKDRVAQLR